MTEETTTKKTAGRPRKTNTVVEPEENVNEDSVEAQDEVVSDGTAVGSSETPSVQEDSPAPDVRIVDEGDDAEVKSEVVRGVTIATETVYRKKKIVNSKRYTYLLVASKGSTF